jgi:hypothetical protein
VTFSVLNKNRVIENVADSRESGLIWVQIQTNELVQESDKYILQVKFKEQVLSQKTLQLNKSMSNYTVSISTNETLILNGGVLSVNLYKVSQGCIDFFK